MVNFGKVPGRSTELYLFKEAKRLAERYGLPVPTEDEARKYSPLGAVARKAKERYLRKVYVAEYRQAALYGYNLNNEYTDVHVSVWDRRVKQLGVMRRNLHRARVKERALEIGANIIAIRPTKSRNPLKRVYMLFHVPTDLLKNKNGEIAFIGFGRRH